MLQSALVHTTNAMIYTDDPNSTEYDRKTGPSRGCGCRNHLSLSFVLEANLCGQHLESELSACFVNFKL